MTNTNRYFQILKTNSNNTYKRITGNDHCRTRNQKPPRPPPHPRPSQMDISADDFEELERMVMLECEEAVPPQDDFDEDAFLHEIETDILG